MFTIAPTQKVLPGNLHEHVMSVYHALNEARVITQGREPELAKAFICIYQYAPQALEVEVYFYLKARGELVRFTHEQGRVGRDLLTEIESQALEFVESLGFMMDSMKLSGLSDSAKRAKLGALPMFAEWADRHTPVPDTVAEEDPFAVDLMEDDFIRPDLLDRDDVNPLAGLDLWGEKSGLEASTLHEPLASVSQGTDKRPSETKSVGKVNINEDVIRFLGLF